MNKIRKFFTNKTAAVAGFLLVILLTLFAIMVSGYYDLLTMQANMEEQKSALIASEVEYLKSVLSASISESEDFAEYVRDLIVQDVKEHYGDDKKRLQEDLEKLNEGIPNDLYDILNRAMDGKYFKGIEKDRDGMFVISWDRIVADRSFSHRLSTTGDTEIDKIVENAFNPIIARQAFDSILDQTNKSVFWICEPRKVSPWYDDLKNIEHMDFSDIERILHENHGNFDIFETFEFLSPTYIFKREDLLGNTVSRIEDTGKHYQLILVVRFNLNDVIHSSSSYSVAVNRLSYDINSLEKDYERYRNSKSTMLVMEAVIFLIALIFITKEYNRLVDRKRSGEGK